VHGRPRTNNQTKPPTPGISPSAARTTARKESSLLYDD
jgi:hypothetical protein